MSIERENDGIFKALSSSTRRHILDVLRDDAKTTGTLCTYFPDLDRCTVMQHLKVLADADLIIVQRKGQVRWNYLNPIPIKRIHDRWIAPYAEATVGLLDKLKLELETR